MTPAELKQILAQGEDSRRQFKRDFSHIDALAAELVAFANTAGGYLCRGLGTGIPRAIDAWPEIELHEVRQSNQFWVVIKRPAERGPLSGLSGDSIETESLANYSAADAQPPLQPEQVMLLQRMFGDHATPELMSFVGHSNRSKFHD